MTTLDQLLTGKDKYFRINLFNTLSGIRTVWMIGTVDLSGRKNLGLFNSIVHIGANPPLLGMISRPETVRRHTLENIRATGFFTLNSVHQAILDKAHRTAEKFSDTEDEFEMLGFDPFYFPNSSIPAVKESPLKVLLRWKEEHLISINKTILVVGEIIDIMLENPAAVDKNGHIHHDIMHHVAVSGLNDYYEISFLKSNWAARNSSLPKQSNS